MHHPGITQSIANELTELKQELQFIEKRLRQIGYSGDCAYEKRMSLLYEEKARTLRNRMDHITFETGLI